MEPDIYCEKEKNNKKDCFCAWIIFGLVAIILSFFIGVLVADLTTIVTVIGTGGIVALLITLVVLLVISGINVVCCKKNDKKKYCC